MAEDRNYLRGSPASFLNCEDAMSTNLAGMLTSVVFGVYPMVLPARNPVYSLTATTAKAGAYAGKVVVDKSLRGY